MTNTTTPSASDSGLNLDYLEATLEKAKSDARHMITIQPAAVLELIALARRAAPVSAPTAGEQADFENYFCMTLSCDDSEPAELIEAARLAASDAWMERARRAALANQPAPTAAPEQVAQGVDERALFEAWTDKEDSPVWVSDIERHQGGYVRVSTDMAWEAWKARAALSQPSEAAPLGQIVAANRDAARYRYLATLMDWGDVERACWRTTAKSAAEFKRGLDKYIDAKLAASPVVRAQSEESGKTGGAV